MKRILAFLFLTTITIALTVRCNNQPGIPEKTDQVAPLIPYYGSGICIPSNIAPLNFCLPDTFLRAEVQMSVDSLSFSYRIKHSLDIPRKDWKRMIEEALVSENDIIVNITATSRSGKTLAYAPVNWSVSQDSIDRFLTFRLVQPIDGAYNEIALYERDLSGFKTTKLISNKLMGNNCFNCHTYYKGEADNMTIHLRKPSEGSLVINGNTIQKVRLPSDKELNDILPDSLQMPLNFVYSAWHPQKDWMAFCTNIIGTAATGVHRRFINLYDSASNIVLYNVKNNEVHIFPQLWTREWEETWPAWSPDGKWLYFCRAPKSDSSLVARYPLHSERIRHIHFDLARIGFDEEKGCFSDSIEIILKSDENRSYSVPRVNPDGQHLVACVSKFNSVPYQAKGDLVMVNLQVFEEHDPNEEHDPDFYQPLDILNSDEAESWHEWSQNGKWMVFASKRADGHYSLPYFTHFNGESFSKPFVLPFRKAQQFMTNLRSYNLPTFVKDHSAITPTGIAKARGQEATPIKVIVH